MSSVWGKTVSVNQFGANGLNLDYATKTGLHAINDAFFLHKEWCIFTHDVNNQQLKPICDDVARLLCDSAPRGAFGPIASSQRAKVKAWSCCSARCSSSDSWLNVPSSAWRKNERPVKLHLFFLDSKFSNGTPC